MKQKLKLVMHKTNKSVSNQAKLNASWLTIQESLFLSFRLNTNGKITMPNINHIVFWMFVYVFRHWLQTISFFGRSTITVTTVIRVIGSQLYISTKVFYLRLEHSLPGKLVTWQFRNSTILNISALVFIMLSLSVYLASR